MEENENFSKVFQNKKMEIKTLIINLPTSKARKNYMQQLLSNYSFLNVEFVDAVDGRVMSRAEMARVFDQKLAEKRYGRLLNGGEVGCTLSHYLCYRKLLSSTNEYVLIFEDDITIVRDFVQLEWSNIQNVINTSIPRILLLSGDYWFWRKLPITKVFSAVGSYAYLINKAAALRIMECQQPGHVADDWEIYKRMGIELYAVHPYAVDANVAEMPSEIQQEYWGGKRSRMSWQFRAQSVYSAIIKRLLVLTKRFESKKRR